MNILTACDSGFFHCVKKLEQNVRFFYQQDLIVYDIGLLPEQAAHLDCVVHKIELGKKHQSYTTYEATDFINATHKPVCLKHYFENYPSDVLYVDADCLFRERVELEGFDVGVTVKPANKMDTTNYYNGIINTGVIFFKTYPKALIERWIQECATGTQTDQSALAMILSETIDWKETGKHYDWHGISVKTLPAEIYNDYYLRNGKIYHFKGDRHDPHIYQELIEIMETGGDVYARFQELTQSKRPFFETLKKYLSRNGR